MKSFTCVLGLVCLTLALPMLAIEEVQQDSRWIDPPRAVSLSEDLDTAEISAEGQAAREFLGRHGGEWTFRVDRRTGKPNLVQGSGLPLIPGQGNSLGAEALAGIDVPPDGRLNVAILEPLARSFVDSQGRMLRPDRGELVFDTGSSLSREDGRLVSFYYNWVVDGVRVEDARVFVRLNSGNVTQFGAPLVGRIDLETTPSIDASLALQILLDRTGDAEVARMQGEPELVIQPSRGAGDEIRYRLVWKFRYDRFGRIENWEGRVDAHTGELIGFVDTNMYAGRAVGGVYPRSVFFQDETTAPMIYVSVDVDGSTLNADTSGAFPYSGGAHATGLDGLWFNTNCINCSSPSQPDVAADVGSGHLDFEFGGVNTQGNGFSSPADRNSFFHLNQVRRVALKWLPALSWLQTQNFTSNVNINNTCNAVYSGNAVNFYRSGGNCNNTGEIADVIYHEWGHGIDGNTQGGGGGTGEGTADVTSMQMSHSAQVGPGFNVNGNPVRNLDSATSSLGVLTVSRIDAGDCGTPPSSHCAGQVFGQSAWDLAGVLTGRHGHHTGWRVSERLFFTSLPDQGTYDPDGPLAIFDAYMMADDDNGNLADGTPNSEQIFQAFVIHGMETTRWPPSAHCTRPAQPVLSVTPQCGQFDLSWTPTAGVDHYEVFRAELREDSALYPVATVPGGSTSHSDAEVAPGVNYWYVVMAVDSSGCESTIETPILASLNQQPILSITVAVDDDTPRGNRSGFADPIEEVDLFLNLKNSGEIDATSVSMTISSTTPGVTILDATSAFNDITTGAVEASQDILRFETDDQLVSCGDVLEFQAVATDTSGCPSEVSYFTVQIGEPDGQGGFVCDLTPACFIKPDFSGLGQASPGASCAETDLSWDAATSNCVNAEITYSVFRSTSLPLDPVPANLVASGVPSTTFHDQLLQPGQSYHYLVRAFDSRSGEEDNTIVQNATATTTPDTVSPVFPGIDMAAAGTDCGEAALSWPPAQEACSAPVTYEIYRSTDPGFTPGPENLVGSTFETALVDAALTPGVNYTYIVRARDNAGNEGSNQLSISVDSTILDETKFETEFEPNDESWAVVAPNDASTGNWEWGNPSSTNYQSGDDATPGGVNAWITGLASGPSNNDVDGGTTTLVSAVYDMSGTADPVVRYAQWFTNDRGNNPGQSSDNFIVEISSDGGSTWAELDNVGAGTPLNWVEIEHALSAFISPPAQVQFRFSAMDLNGGSLVEAGIDDFSLVDRNQGCVSAGNCTLPAQTVSQIVVMPSGNDIELDWDTDPVQATRFIVYKLVGADFSQEVRIGSTTARTFVHSGAMLSDESFSYRVSAVDACGNESALE